MALPGTSLGFLVDKPQATQQGDHTADGVDDPKGIADPRAHLLGREEEVACRWTSS